jgi:transcriptional regulator GlxA family with amidase domain
VNICSVCNAAFILGEAGLLDHKECTTHWRSVGLLQQMYPDAKVLNDVLFVKQETFIQVQVSVLVLICLLIF